jgi:hypothetical protein
VDLAPNKLAFIYSTLVIGLTAIGGCQRAGRLEAAGIALRPPATWQPVDRQSWMVPGEPLAAWSGPDGGSLVVYRTLRIPGGTAEMVAEALGNRLLNLPGLKLLVKGTETVGGLAAARVEVVAPGSGDSLAASGLGTPVEQPGKASIPTRAVTLGFPRNGDTIFITWNVPQSSYDRALPEFTSAMESLRLDPGDAPRRLGY